jgi:hypothetical protein
MADPNVILSSELRPSTLPAASLRACCVSLAPAFGCAGNGPALCNPIFLRLVPSGWTGRSCVSHRLRLDGRPCGRPAASPHQRRALSLSSVSPHAELPWRCAEAQRGEAEEIQKLIAAGMDPSAANGVGQTALHVACLWGTHKCVEVLIKAGANVSCSKWPVPCFPVHSFPVARTSERFVRCCPPGGRRCQAL